MQKSIDDIDFEKSGGLIPIIVQDANTKDVLTLAYSNKESLELTKKTGNSWFWSRSRNKLSHLNDKQDLKVQQDK